MTNTRSLTELPETELGKKNRQKPLSGDRRSSLHSQIWKALDKAKNGDRSALFAEDVLDRMSFLSRDELTSDPEIAEIKAEMKAAGLSRKKWMKAVADYRRSVLADRIVYEDRRGLGPNPKSRRNVQQFLDAAHAEVWFDEFNKKVFLELDGNTTPLDDDSLRELMFLMRESGLPIDKDPAGDALSSLAHRNKRHPVREYLNGLEWDGIRRVDTWLPKYAGARDTKLNRVYGRKFLIGAVRRIMQPGVKLRAMPILEVVQNIVKSLVFMTLAVEPDWYTDILELGCDPKEVIELTEGKWIVETPELSGMTNRDVEHVKAMISRDVDKARLAYGRFSTEVPRQFVLGGTTNTEEYLKDRTGNTRFWGIKIFEKPDIEALEEDRDQLWAEAVQIEASGEAHWLDTPELQALAQKSVQKREEQNPLEQTWIATFEQVRKKGDIFLSSDDLYRHAGLDDVSRIHQGHKNSLRYAAKRAGWISVRKRTGHDLRPYGYVPDGVEPEKATLAVYDRITKRFKTAAKPRGGATGL